MNYIIVVLLLAVVVAMLLGKPLDFNVTIKHTFDKEPVQPPTKAEEDQQQIREDIAKTIKDIMWGEGELDENQ